MRVVAYVRVSTEEQASEGVSLAAQTVKVRLYCELHNLDLVGVETDAGVSAKTLDRPGLNRVLQILETGQADGLVVAKLDRLSRSVSDWAELVERYFGRDDGPQLFSVADSIDTRTAAGRLVLNVLMSVAQWERETIVERTRDAINHKRRRLERCGTVPYGSRLRDDGITLEDEPAERIALDRMRELRAGGMSLRAIGRTLEGEGIMPKEGGSHWHPTTLARLIDRVECFTVEHAS